MDKEEFNRRIMPLLRWSKRKDRYVLKPTEAKPCTYCTKSVANQTISAEVYRLGTALQHFKHKCQTCKLFVFDASADDPRKIAPSLHLKYYKPSAKVSVNGVRLGRPPKYRPEEPKRARGRPKKAQS